MDALRHPRARDLRFFVLLVATLGLIAGYLGNGLRVADQEGGSSRAVDRPVLERRIEAGDLRMREADWYRREARQ